MSTRCQLRFVDRGDRDSDPSDGARVAQVYRHSDGCPESVLRDLAQLQELLEATHTERGPGYTAATFIFLEKLSAMGLSMAGDANRTIDADQPADLLEPGNLTQLDQPLFLLGHGIENPSAGIHGDEEYLYVVEHPSERPFEQPGEWTVRVSHHCGFPRWDGPTEEAFERASWQFRGALDAALTELIVE